MICRDIKRPAWDFFFFFPVPFFVLFRDDLQQVKYSMFFFLFSIDEEGLAALKTSNIYSLVMTHEVLVYQCNVLLLSLNAYSLRTDGPESNQKQSPK